MQRLRIKIYGKVQGVGFRFYAAEKAKELALAGWVRNCDGDCVEIVCEGEPEKVEAMRAWAARGPHWARVRSVEVVEEQSGSVCGFEIRD